MRPKSTESSLPRIWRRCVLTCGRSWPIRPSFYSSNSLCRPSSPSSWRSTSLHHLHRSDLQGSPLPLYCFYLASEDTGYFVWEVRTLDILFGRGGYGDRVLCFCVLFIVVLVLVVCSIFSVFRILVVFCFSYFMQLLVVCRFSFSLFRIALLC